MRRFSRQLAFLALGLLQSCTGFEGVRDTLDPSGPSSLAPYNYNPYADTNSRGQIALFEAAYRIAYSEAARIDAGTLAPPNSSDDPVSRHARQMAVEGVHLADSYCELFFRYGGDNQKWLLVSRDLVAALGSIATGAVALAGRNASTATGILALTTAGLYNGVDIYTRNFLFGSDNIESVRTMTMKALAAHSAAALPDHDTSVWTFGGAAQVVTEHQMICTPASIRNLVLQAIKAGSFVAAPAAAQAEASLSGKAPSPTTAATAAVPAASAAAAAAAPAVAPAAAAAARAAAAAAGPAATAAAAVPGADLSSIVAAARKAAQDGARRAAAAAAPRASPGAVNAAAAAAANEIAPAAGAAAEAARAAIPPNQAPATRQFELHVVQPARGS